MGLLEIAKLPTAENAAIHLHAADNIAIARVPLQAGQSLRIDGTALTVEDPIPAGHKVALRPIATEPTTVDPTPSKGSTTQSPGRL